MDREAPNPRSASQLSRRREAPREHLGGLPDAAHGQPIPNSVAKIQGVSPGIARARAQAGLKVNTGLGSMDFARHQAAMQPLLGTQIESDLIDADLIHATGLAPSSNVSADTLRQVSPLRGLDPSKRRSFVDGVRRDASAHGHCFGPESEAALTATTW